jgi:hypothetical protein
VRSYITATLINDHAAWAYFRFVERAKERDMTSENRRKPSEPSVAMLTAKLVLLFVAVSLVLSFAAGRAGLLPDRTSPLDLIAPWATTN